MMKRKYITPNTELVKVQLTDGFLEDEISIGDQSDRSGYALGKEQNNLFDMDDDAFGDIWGTEEEDPNDLWGDN